MKKIIKVPTGDTSDPRDANTFTIGVAGAGKTSWLQLTVDQIPELVELLNRLYEENKRKVK